MRIHISFELEEKKKKVRPFWKKIIKFPDVFFHFRFGEVKRSVKTFLVFCIIMLCRCTTKKDVINAEFFSQYSLCVLFKASITVTQSMSLSLCLQESAIECLSVNQKAPDFTSSLLPVRLS